MKSLLFALTLLSTPLMASPWECTARIPWPGVVFLGHGETQAEAQTDALDNCHAGRHAACFNAGCTDLQDEPGTVTDDHGKVHGLGYRGHPRKDGVLFWAPKVKSAAPASYDLRTMGWVAPIRDQKSCGSCWAFSITKALESARLRAGLAPFDLSEQEMVSCDKNAYGCSGGMMDDMDYVVKHGLPLETVYPYTASTGRCQTGKPVAAKGVSWGYVGAQGRQPTTAEIKQTLLNNGVLSVVVAAGGSDWSRGGHMTGCRTSGQNHMVNLAGWLTTDELIVANSWGSDWGDHGFAYAKQGCNELAKGDQSVSFVVVDGGPGPLPPHVLLPSEVDVVRGWTGPIGVKEEDGVSYSWTADGVALSDTTSIIYVTPEIDTVYQITAKTAAGTAQSSVKVHILTSEVGG